MTRSQWAALAGAALLVVGAFVVRERSEQAPASSDPRLAELRAAAALDDCPRGLGPQLPALVLPCLSGGPDVELRSAPPGKPTLVNVWATWCRPCVEEVPDLVAFADKAGGQVAVVGVLTEDSQTNALEFSRQFGVRYPSVVDADGEVFRAFRPGPPVTLFLDASGRVVHKRSGKFDDVAEIEALVREHLGVTV